MVITSSKLQRLILVSVISLILVIGASSAFADESIDSKSNEIKGISLCGCTTRPSTTTTTSTSTTTTTAPTTTTTSSTTTTTAPTTTSTSTTTTTAPTTTTTSSTTTTTAPTTTTTDPGTTTLPSTTVLGTVVTAPSTTVQVKGTSVSSQLAVTGSQSIFVLIVALSIIGVGLVLVVGMKKRSRSNLGVDSYRTW